MNDLKKNKINEFLNDDVMREAVKEVILSVTNVDLSKYANFQADNGQLGEEIRAIAQAKDLINQGFDKLSNYLIGENPIKKGNPAI